MSHADTNSQPAPKPNDRPAVWSMVMRDMVDRDIFGAEKYRTRLQPGNGRDFLVDAYQEALDLVVYLRGAIYERDNLETEKPAHVAPDHWAKMQLGTMNPDFGQQNQLSGRTLAEALEQQNQMQSKPRCATCHTRHDRQDSCPAITNAGPMLRCPDCIADHCACIAS